MRVYTRTLVGTAFLCLSAGVAFGADILTIQSVAQVAAFTWTGFYVGAYGGGSFAGRLTSQGTAGDSSVVERPGGFVGGGLAGYKYQIGRVVAGIEGDVGVSGGSGRSGQYTFGDFGFGETMAYAASGVSSQTRTETMTTPPAPAASATTIAGFDVGAGFEIAATSSVLARAEHVYDDYGKENYFLSNGGAVVQNRSVKINDSTVRAALQYKF